MEQLEQEAGQPEPASGRPGLFSYYFPGWANWRAADKPSGEEEADAQRKIGMTCTHRHTNALMFDEADVSCAVSYMSTSP